MADAIDEVDKASEQKSSDNADARVSEPDNIVCPITHVMFRDPVFVPESGNTYEQDAIVRYWANQQNPRDPLTNTPLPGAQLHTNWGIRREVQRFLDANPEYVPQGWPDRKVPPPASSKQTRDGIPMVAKPAMIAVSVVFAAVAAGCAGHAAWKSLGWLNVNDARGFENAVDDARGTSGLQFNGTSATGTTDIERLRPPRDSEIEAVKSANGVLEIRVPPSGLSTEALGQALFTAVWLGVTLTWTVGMLNGNAPWFVIAFSLMFWGSGASMMLNIGRMVFAHEVISLDAEHFSISTVALGYPFEQVQGMLPDLIGPPEVECDEPSACCVVFEDGQSDTVHVIPEIPRLRRPEAKWLQSIISDHLEHHLGHDFVAERGRSSRGGSTHERETEPPDDDRDRDWERARRRERDRFDERRSRSRRKQPLNQFHSVGGGLPMGGGFGGVGGFAFGPGFAFVLR